MIILANLSFNYYFKASTSLDISRHCQIHVVNESRTPLSLNYWILKEVYGQRGRHSNPKLQIALQIKPVILNEIICFISILCTKNLFKQQCL